MTAHARLRAWHAQAGAYNAHLVPFDEATSLLAEYDAAVAIVRSHAQGRCYPCGWPLKLDAKDGCVPGNCSLRDQHATDHSNWLARANAEQAILSADPS